MLWGQTSFSLVTIALSSGLLFFDVEREDTVGCIMIMVLIFVADDPQSYFSV